MVVFGGYDGSSLKNDAWVLANANGLDGSAVWTDISPGVTAPTARNSHSVVLDTANNLLILYGGHDGSTPVSDVWVLTNANAVSGTPAWTQLTPSGSPLLRRGHSAAYDPSSNRMIVFGGYDGSVHNDVWVLTDANGLGGTPGWVLLSPSGTAPAAREAHTAVYDAANNRLVVFGGRDGVGPLNDVWVLTNANGLGGTPTWAQLAPTGGPPSARELAGATYDAGLNRMVLFGGRDAGNSSLNDTWVLTNANGLGESPTWSALGAFGSAPSVRASHTSVYDAVAARVIVFAGVGTAPSGPNNEVWILKNARGGP
jgi:hypothetical protein